MVDTVTETAAAAAARAARLAGYWAQDPDNLSLQRDLADAQLQACDWDSARKTLLYTLKQHPADALARYRLAVAERCIGQGAAALTLLEGLWADGERHPAVAQELALVQAQAGRWHDVVATLSAWSPEALDALPAAQADDLYLLRVRALHHLGEVEEALALAQCWQARRSENLPLPGLAALATLQLDTDQLAGASESLSRCAPEQLDANAELLAVAGYVALAEGRAADAQARFARSAALLPQLGRAHLGEGLAWAAQGELPTALKHLQAAVATTPQHLGSWHALAWMQLLAEDVDAASASFASALAQDRTFGDTHGGLAIVAALRGQRASAEESLRIALRLDPNSMNAAVAKVLLTQSGGLRDAQVLGRCMEAVQALPQAQSGSLASLMPRWLAMAAQQSPGK